MVVASLAVSACGRTHRLSNPPDPPLTAADWLAIYAAHIGIVAVCAFLLAYWIARTLPARRIVAVAILCGYSVLVVGTIAREYVIDYRERQVLDGGDCRAIPVEDRPSSIIELRCNTSTVDVFSDEPVLWLIAVVLVGGAALTPFLVALLVARDTRRWGPGRILTGLALLAVAWDAAASFPKFDDTGDVVAYASAALLTMSFVLQRPSPRKRVSTASRA